MLPPYLYRLCSICHSRRSARTLHSWVQDKAHWGPLDAWSCPVMGRDTFLMSYFLSPLCPPPPHLLRPGCNYEGNYSSIVFPLPLSLLPVCSLQTNYSLVNSSFFSPSNYFSKRKNTVFFTPPVILGDLHHDSWRIFIIQTVNQSSGLSLHVCLVRV